MGISKNWLFVGVTILLVVAAKQSEANTSLGNKLAQTFAGANVRFDVNAAVGGNDESLLVSKAKKAFTEVHTLAANETTNVHIREAIDVLKAGWEKTIKVIALGLDAAFDLCDTILSKDIKDKEAALNAIHNGINEVRTIIFKAGNKVHSALGAAKAMVNITDTADFKYGIGAIQETGSGLFDDLDTVKFFAIQGLNAESDEVKKKCLKAAHAAIISAAEMANAYMVAGAKIALRYLSTSDETTLSKQEPTEKLISDATKTAAATDSDTMEALSALEKDFSSHIALGNVAPFLNILKKGLVEYIEYSAWSVAICYDAVAQARELIKTDPKAAMSLIDKAFELAKSILIDGSIKAYEGIGAAGRAIGLLEKFEDAIEIAERIRVEGTKSFDSAKTVIERAMKTGGEPADHALNAAHKMLEANEAVMFDKIHQIRNLVFKLLKLE